MCGGSSSREDPEIITVDSKYLTEDFVHRKKAPVTASSPSSSSAAATDDDEGLLHSHLRDLHRQIELEDIFVVLFQFQTVGKVDNPQQIPKSTFPMN